MFKNILLSTLLCSFLGAQDFETFLKNAIQNSPYLKANQLGIVQANENAKLITRYKNPTLALEASNFSPDIGDSEAGYRVALTQPIRLWGVSDAREDLATAQKSEAQSLVKLSRADFVRKLSLLYSKYKSTLSAESLAKEELLISKKITNITKARFENGTIAKVKYIQ
ncbi:MAG: TolC family protein, partial [Sulfurimonas sp.]|nr:TolC family protein [Sulfurimonas sp.]